MRQAGEFRAFDAHGGQDERHAECSGGSRPWKKVRASIALNPLNEVATSQYLHRTW
jgi:hypothetical protein